MVHNVPMKRALFSLTVAALALTGCAQFPALERTITTELVNAPYPDLVPLAPILARAQEPGVDPARANTGLDARVSALKGRAARLRGSIFEGPARQRLGEGLQ